MAPQQFTVAFPLGVTVGKWAGVFQNRHPDVELTVSLMSRSDEISAVRAGDVDIAFARLPVEPDRFRVVALYQENLVVVLPQDHLRASAGSLRIADLEGQNVFEDEPDAEMMSSVVAGTGLAVMPESVWRSLRRRDLVALRLEDAESSGVALIWRPESDDPLIQDFVGVARGRGVNSSRSSGPARAV